MVLIKNVVLDAIFDGQIDTLFRRQKRPTVRAGGTLRTRRGMLDILEVDAMADADVSADDARRAGFEAVADVLASVKPDPDATLFRVRVRPGGPDPRDELRNRSDLTADELADLTARLDRMDRASETGPWTRGYLALIADHPHTRAPDLAAGLGLETKPFKDRVRRLKGLGLTISHSPGYELSPRGRTVLDALVMAALRETPNEASAGPGDLTGAAAGEPAGDSN